MRPLYNGIKTYHNKDLSSDYYVQRAMRFAEVFDCSKDYVNINEVIEIYNVHEILSNKDLKPEIINKYKTKIKECMLIVAKFFNSIDDTNFEKYYDEICVGYIDEFWCLFEKFKTYIKVSESCFYTYISKPSTILYYILSHKKIVEYYDDAIAKCMRQSDQAAEIIVHRFMEKQTGSEIKYLPKSLKPKEYEEILRRYILSEHPTLTALILIESYQSNDECPVTDKLRLAARNRKREMLNDGSVKIIDSGMKVGVSFRDISDFMSVEQSDEGELFLFDRKWIKDNLDYPTVLNNFIFLFGYVDKECRSIFPVIESKSSVFEKIFGAKGVKDYPISHEANYQNIKASVIMQGYIEELKLNGIQIEDVIKWFFEVYLVEEFNVNGFLFSPSSKDSSPLEMCRNLASEMESVMKQFMLFVEDGEINRELLEMSSKPKDYMAAPSLRQKKYAYANSDELKDEMHYLFSSQSMLSYIDRIGDRYYCLCDLLINEMVKLDDYIQQDEITRIDWLIKRKALISEDGILKVNFNRTFILKDLYDHGVICSYYYSKPIQDLLDEMSKSGDVIFLNSFFSRLESDYISFVLNKSKYNNGFDLRNKYVHGSCPMDENINRQDYIELLKIMILIVIKINEEFSVRDQISNNL